MIKNIKAEGGIMEALLAMMVATIALSAFIGVVAITAVESEVDVNVPISFTHSLYVENNEIKGIDDNFVEQECQRNGFLSMTVIVIVFTDDGEITFKSSCSPIGDIIGFEKGTFRIPGENGLVFTATYEVVAFA